MSKLYVDNLYPKTTSNTVIPASKPIYGPGQIVQVGYQDGITYQGTEGTTVNNTTGKLIEVVLTLKTTNPIIRARYSLPIGQESTYTDRDLALGFGIRNAAVSNTVGDYSNFGGITGKTRHNVVFGDASAGHYITDTMGSAGSGAQYWMDVNSFEYQAAVTMAAGTYCSVALWAATDGTYYFYRAGNNGGSNTDTGATGGLVVEEIAT